jgi:hypothetical protein
MAKRKGASPAQDEFVDETGADELENGAQDEANDGGASAGTPEESANLTETAEEEKGASPAQVNLHVRLEKAVRKVQAGPREVHYPLHKVEMLTGALKLALPEAIKAAEGSDLKPGLQKLLDIL